jgi:hypothetical protein
MRQPDQVDELLEEIRRAWCRWFGHRWVLDTRGAPVTTFNVCARCGKWVR